MEINLETQELDTLRNQLNEDGYVILKNFINKDFVNYIKQSSEAIFQIQFDEFGYVGDFKENMIRLFNEHEDIFKNLYKLEEIYESNKYFGLLDNIIIFVL